MAQTESSGSVAASVSLNAAPKIAEDGADNGNRKLVPLISRHGGGLDDNDYINCNMKGWCAKITEGKTKLEVMNNREQQSDGFLVEDNNEDSEQIPFE